MLENKNDNTEQPVYELINQIKDGTLNPKILKKDLRQSCVEILLAEGYSPFEMAQLFKTCEKTIKRDTLDIFEQNALSPNVDQAKRIIGEFLMYARVHRDKLMKLARVKGVSVSERLQAEYMAFKVFSETVTRLQTLGYLPSKPQAIVGDIFHHVGDGSVQLDDLDRQIIELGNMAEGDDAVSQKIKSDVEKIRKLANEIKTQKETNSQEKDNE